MEEPPAPQPPRLRRYGGHRAAVVRCHGQVGRLRAREFRVGRGPVVAVPNTTHHAARERGERC